LLRILSHSPPVMDACTHTCARMAALSIHAISLLASLELHGLLSDAPLAAARRGQCTPPWRPCPPQPQARCTAACQLTAHTSVDASDHQITSRSGGSRSGGSRTISRRTWFLDHRIDAPWGPTPHWQLNSASHLHGEAHLQSPSFTDHTPASTNHMSSVSSGSAPPTPPLTTALPQRPAPTCRPPLLLGALRRVGQYGAAVPSTQTWAALCTAG